jgi:Diguanylate cyclase, GGDEF domain
MAWSGVWSEPEQRHFFVGRDMTEQKAAEEKLWRLAHFDQLTGLPNRTSLAADLNAMLDESAAIGSHHAIAIIGLDGFKDINDTLAIRSATSCCGRLLSGSSWPTMQDGHTDWEATNSSCSYATAATNRRKRDRRSETKQALEPL